MVDVRAGLNQQPRNLCMSTESRHGKGRVARLLETETWAKYGSKSEHERFEHTVILHSSRRAR